MAARVVAKWVAMGAVLSFLAAAAASAQRGPVISSIEFAGRANVPESTLRQAIALRLGDPLTPSDVEADRKALLALGYFRSVAASWGTMGTTAQLTFRLTEWPRVTHVRVLGNTVVELREIQDALSTRLGEVLSTTRLRADVEAIERLYRQRGYVARISNRLLDEATRSGIVRFEILEVQIADVQVEGGTPKLQERARRVLTELPPKLYRPVDVGQDQRRLLRERGITGAIPRVEITEPGKVRIRWLLNPPPDTITPQMPR